MSSRESLSGALDLNRFGFLPVLSFLGKGEFSWEFYGRIGKKSALSFVVL